MMQKALNHMTAPRLGHVAFLDLAQSLGCVGVEFRNDLGTPLFDGVSAEEAGQKANERGLRIVGLSQVYPFNFFTDAIRDEVAALIATAKACGAETISLIPRNDGQGLGNGERIANLRLALREIKPMLEEADMIALVEPLGFLRSSLRSKAETVEVIEAINGADRFKIVHDTFHHALAGGGPIFPEQTGIVHISGVADETLAVDQMEDEHRVLVDANDRLRNIEQLEELFAAGYSGPVSYECFSPVVHAFDDPFEELSESFEFVASRLGGSTA